MDVRKIRPESDRLPKRPRLPRQDRRRVFPFGKADCPDCGTPRHNLLLGEPPGGRPRRPRPTVRFRSGRCPNCCKPRENSGEAPAPSGTPRSPRRIVPAAAAHRRGCCDIPDAPVDGNRAADRFDPRNQITLLKRNDPQQMQSIREIGLAPAPRAKPAPPHRGGQPEEAARQSASPVPY